MDTNYLGDMYFVVDFLSILFIHLCSNILRRVNNTAKNSFVKDFGFIIGQYATLCVRPSIAGSISNARYL